jgi:hypothetical protein
MAGATPAAGGKRGKLSRLLLGILVSVLIFFGTFAMLEGATSTIITLWDISFNPQRELPSRLFSVHDTLTGWRNTPGFHNADMYGPGEAVVVNSQSFREAEDIPAAVPDGKIRLICSGDSFTFGIGVGNEKTWCSLLETLHPRLETVNFGHAGFSIDQAYLLYQREAKKLEHDVHVFAFIPDDIRRMQLDRFVGYAKPYFQLVGDSVQLKNVPVPEPGRFGTWYRRRVEHLSKLRIVQFGDRLHQGSSVVPKVNTYEDAKAIAVRLFQDLSDSAARDGRTAVFVLLDEWNEGELFTQLEDYFEAELGARGLHFVNIREPFRTVPADTLLAMYYRQWGNHYSTRGNQRVAELLWPRLSELLASLLAAGTAGATGPH